MNAGDAGSIATLIDQIGRHLGALAGPGLADVMEGFGRWRGGSGGTFAPRANAVVDARLPATLAAMENRVLAEAIRDAAPLLGWVTYDLYDRAQIGDTFPANHAFASVIGPAGPVPAENFEIGLFLIAPGVFYRDHRHAAPELYAPLTGPHGWRFAPGEALEWKHAPEPVWNPPFQPHATLAGRVPFLCVYAWTAEIDAPAAVVPAADWAAIEAGT